MTATPVRYVIWVSGTIRKGDARQVLEQLRAAIGRDNPEVRQMSVDEYAAAVIEDAPYFMDQRLAEAIGHEDFASDYDKALTYLAASPSSQIRILNRIP